MILSRMLAALVNPTGVLRMSGRVIERVVPFYSRFPSLPGIGAM